MQSLNRRAQSVVFASRRIGLLLSAWPARGASRSRTLSPNGSARQTPQFLHIPARDGRARPIEGRDAAMTLLQAVHVVAHAVLRGAFSIRWASPPSHSE